MTDPKHQLATALRKLAQDAESGEVVCLGLFAFRTNGDRQVLTSNFDAHSAYLLLGGLQHVVNQQSLRIAHLEAQMAAAASERIVRPGTAAVNDINRTKN